VGGRLADRFSPSKASMLLLIIMAVSLALVSLFSWNKGASIALTFVTGALSFALAAPIQMLMIQTAKGAEMIAAAVAQACFNIGNALGAYLGGLPLAAGYAYTAPEWVGVIMALTGAASMGVFIYYVNSRNTNAAEEEASTDLPAKAYSMH
jgi:MFS transporter, DHA1 family, arabinose polymer utilization protein